LSQLNEDDFKIFYCFIKKYLFGLDYNKEKLDNGQIEYIKLSIENRLIQKQLIGVVLNKFKTFNLLIDSSSINSTKDKKDNIESKISDKFGVNEYTLIFFEILNNYFKDTGNDFCEKILEENEEYGKIRVISLNIL